MGLFAAFESAKCIEKSCLQLKLPTSWGNFCREKQVGGFRHRWFLGEDHLTLLRRKTQDSTITMEVGGKELRVEWNMVCEVICNLCDNKMGC